VNPPVTGSSPVQPTKRKGIRKGSFFHLNLPINPNHQHKRVKQIPSQSPEDKMKIDDAVEVLVKLKKDGVQNLSLIIWTDSEIKRIGSGMDKEITDEEVDEVCDQLDDIGLELTGNYLDDIVSDL
jgi:hypothetical protein